MRTLPKVALIGAGSSGLPAVKALKDRGFPFDCFEASDRVGGNWVYDNANGMSAAYRGLHINTSRERMQYAALPMPPHLPDFPHHAQIATYFEAYAERFGLLDHITFSTRVLSATRDPARGTWTLTLDDGTTRDYDALLVANGHHWDARWPEPAFAGHDTTLIDQRHAHDYRNEDDLRDKDVVVLGMGNSAMDIAVESSTVARSTHLAARSGVWVVPKYLLGRPSDQLPNDPRIPWRVRRALLERILLASVGRMERYGLPQPAHRFGEAHPTLSGRILDRLAHGAITAHPNIARLHEREVEFTDGVRVPCEVVIYCTGYRITFPFFAPELISAPDNRIGLFRRVLHPEIANVAFLGLVQPIGAVMPLAEAQAEWVADHLAGTYHRPSAEAEAAAIRTEDEAMRKRYVASKRHTIQVDFDEYLLQLAAERRAGAARAEEVGRRLPVAPRVAEAEARAAAGAPSATLGA